MLEKQKDSDRKSFLIGRYGAAVWGLVSLYCMTTGIDLPEESKDTFLGLIQQGDQFITGAMSIIMAAASKIRSNRRG